MRERKTGEAGASLYSGIYFKLLVRRFVYRLADSGSRTRCRRIDVLLLFQFGGVSARRVNLKLGYPGGAALSSPKTAPDPRPRGLDC
jgi:hypothetical protein